MEYNLIGAALDGTTRLFKTANYDIICEEAQEAKFITIFYVSQKRSNTSPIIALCLLEVILILLSFVLRISRKMCAR